MKHYSSRQAAALNNLHHETLKKRLQRDKTLPPKKRKYPGARRCECGMAWLIPAKDIKGKKG